MEEELQFLGLSLYESRLVSILIKESLNLRDLSTKTGVPFGKVYSVVKSLKDKGIVHETETRPKMIYIENASNVIANLISQRQSHDEKIIQKLRETATEADKAKGEKTSFFQVGTTAKDNHDIQLRSFLEAEKEVFQILNIYHRPVSNRASKIAWEKEIVNAVSRGVIFKSIYPVKAELPKMLDNLNKKFPTKFQVHRKDTDFPRCDIIDKKKVLVKLVNQDPTRIGGIIFIEDEKLANNLTAIFNEMWEESS